MYIRFDTEKIDSDNYAFECWKVFWNAVGRDRFKGYLVGINEGTTEGTTNGQENVYCITVDLYSTIFSNLSMKGIYWLKSNLL